MKGTFLSAGSSTPLMSTVDRQSTAVEFFVAPSMGCEPLPVGAAASARRIARSSASATSASGVSP